LRFDPDETKSVMDMVAAKHLRFDEKPVHQIRGSRREVLELAFYRKTQTVVCRCGSHLAEAI
jgi:hypothetical protein